MRASVLHSDSSIEFAVELRQRETHLKASVARFGVETDFALMLLDNPVDGVQPQSSAFTLRLGGEERFEDASLNFGRNAGAVIVDFDQDVIGLGCVRTHRLPWPFIASIALTIRLVQI